jgi:hypothetical protein
MPRFQACGPDCHSRSTGASILRIPCRNRDSATREENYDAGYGEPGGRTKRAYVKTQRDFVRSVIVTSPTFP